MTRAVKLRDDYSASDLQHGAEGKRCAPTSGPGRCGSRSTRRTAPYDNGPGIGTQPACRSVSLDLPGLAGAMDGQHHGSDKGQHAA